jgi:predicted XRE-type DNA-binding protein
MIPLDYAMKNNDILIEESSGNIFADLGYANAEEALLKSNLAQAIIEVIEQQKWEHLTSAMSTNTYTKKQVVARLST